MKKEFKIKEIGLKADTRLAGCFLAESEISTIVRDTIDYYKMNDKLTLTGTIVSGVKKGAFFTQLDWVQRQCQEKLRFSPFPGTLNLEIEEAKIPLIEALLQRDGIELVPPDSSFCTGYLYPASIMGVSGAIVAPAEDVRIHGKNIIELIAATSLKDALDVDDGDEIMLVITPP
jgi:CTP-dependent riboflavin kinase